MVISSDEHVMDRKGIARLTPEPGVNAQRIGLIGCRRQGNGGFVTSLVAWVGADKRGQSSCYIATDSRLSWSPTITWDIGRKVFASATAPDLFGYCGDDVTFPTHAIGQIVECINRGVLYELDASAQCRLEAVATSLKTSLQRLPAVKAGSFSVLYCTRSAISIHAKFHAWTLKWSAAVGWEIVEHFPLERESSVITYLGSGKRYIKDSQTKRDKALGVRTSRSIFGAFCDAISEGADPITGGVPQLVAIYRAGPARSVGIVKDGIPYLLGLPVAMDVAKKQNSIEWRNSLFERCGPDGVRLDDAQPQPMPLSGK
jgi:hypothetical protein